VKVDENARTLSLHLFLSLYDLSEIAEAECLSQKYKISSSSYKVWVILLEVEGPVYSSIGVCFIGCGMNHTIEFRILSIGECC